MAYSSPNLKLIAGETWQRDRLRVWSYSSTDAMTTVRVVDYIADARLRGMAVGDIVYVTQTTDGAITAITLTTVMAIDSGGAADLADGVAITVTNTD